MSKSRRKEALDEFFEVIGKERCKQAKVVWDKFHLIQSFNEALNEERKEEFNKAKDAGDDVMELIRGKFKYLFTSKNTTRSRKDKEHLIDVLTKNKKLLSTELIKERLHRMYHHMNKEEALEELNRLYEWSLEAGAKYLSKWFWNLLGKAEFANYFDHPFTTNVSEGINRVIKGLKWQAYGYKDMTYFGLKILQKCGYLNYRYALNDFNHLD